MARSVPTLSAPKAEGGRVVRAHGEPLPQADELGAELGLERAAQIGGVDTDVRDGIVAAEHGR